LAISYELLTAVVIFVSKYLLRAYEKINKEKIDINNDGINVNNEKKITYFLFATDPLTFKFSFKEFFI
jgi:hypothetical protein